MPPPIRIGEFAGDAATFLEKYAYQPDLTTELDDVGARNFNPELLNKIVLWKVNRYEALDGDLLGRIDALRNLKPGEHAHARSLLEQLLATRGVDLPMASTILRFRSPSVFQIIDRHAYRALYGRKYAVYTQTPVGKKIEVYFAYLDDVRRLCDANGLRFETVDRVLYVFDKENNGSLAAVKNTE